MKGIFILTKHFMSDPELASHWEAILKKEGLSSDVGVDRGAAALREQKMAEAGIPMRDIQNEVRLYWLNRDEGSDFGAHVQKAREIAHRFSVSEEIVDSDFMRSIEDEIAEAQRAVQSAADELTSRSASLAFRPEILRRQLMTKMTESFGEDFSRSVISALVDGYISRLDLQ